MRPRNWNNLFKAAAFRQNIRRADAAALGCITVVLSAVYAGFFGRYAFDDSYVGYTIARSLLEGRGFTFNFADRTLSTSAPLAPPIYAGLAAVFHADVVVIAQVVSALAMAVVAYGTYALARRYCAPAGAFCAATIMTCSPFTLLLWSHETLLYMAVCIVALHAFALRRGNAAALTAGFACLLRGEALLMLPFLWYAQWRRAGGRSALAFAILSLLPFAIWIALAVYFFGGFASQTIASKRVQLLYPSTLPYLLGAIEYSVYTFSFDHTRIASALVAVAAGVAAYGSYANRLFSTPYAMVFLWAAATTALYAALGMEFYFWFLVQFGVALAACAAALWPRDARTFPAKPALNGGRIGAVIVTAATMVFLILEMRRGLVRGQYWSAAVMPELRGNAYKSIGLWFARHAAPRDRIAYPEFGQMRYYSGRDLVDYLGLVSTGATAQLADNNAIWSFKAYRPQWVVEDATWHVFVDPLEYDWFRAAYRPVSEQIFPGDPTRSRFTIYRLRERAFIPAPDVRAHDARVISLANARHELRIAFATRSSFLREAEVRVRAVRSCFPARVALLRGGTPVVSRLERIPAGVERLSVDVPPQPPAAYALQITGCAVTLAPRLPLRHAIPRLLEPPIEPGSPADALTVYAQPV